MEVIYKDMTAIVINIQSAYNNDLSKLLTLEKLLH